MFRLLNNTQLFKYQYSLLAFLAKMSKISRFFTKIIFLIIKICLMALFAIFLKLGQMFVLKYDFLPDFSLMRILVLK